jgi:exodeoxyribonuclease-3
LLLFFKKEVLPDVKIVTWNVNGIRARETNICAWLEKNTPDLLLMQEIKCEAAAFPPCFEALGYQAAIVGQKGFNGVAILSRQPVEITCKKLPGLSEDDEQARYVEVEAEGLRVGNLYLPNGNSRGEDGYQYKLNWMDALAARAEALLAEDTPLVLAGDYNVCPEDVDFAQGVLSSTDALVRPETRARYWRLIWAGLTDGLRAVVPTGPVYTFWDYQAGCWARDRGLRIDHMLLSPTVAERMVSVKPDKAERGLDQPSDHVPVVLELA